MTTGKDISEWFDEGVRRGATHMIVVCDTFDYEDYPVYVMEGQDAKGLVQGEYSGQNMQKMMEVYNLKKRKALQIAKGRNYEY